MSAPNFTINRLNGIEPTRTETLQDNTIYLGFALDTCTGDNDAKWMIKRITSQGAIDTISYPQGSKSFTFKWSERATLSYKITPTATIE